MIVRKVAHTVIPVEQVPIIPYRPHDFPLHLGHKLQVPATIDCAWSDILRAAITVGRRNAQAVFAHGLHSVFEATYRAYMIKANLTEDEASRLVRTKVYQELDPSEKGAVSYFLSMGLVKLLCEHLFGVPWLVHLDNFQGEIDPPLGRGSRPDLIGKDGGDGWVVVEVKGRSNDMPDNVLNDGKQQCQMIERVEGQAPSLRLVGGLYFSDHRVQTVLRDPDADKETRSELKIGRAKLLREYYAPLVEAVSQGGQRSQTEIGGRRYDLARFEGLDFELGIDHDLSAALNEPGDDAFMAEVLRASRTPSSSIAEPRVEEIRMAEPSVQLFRTRTSVDLDLPRSESLGLDGTIVRLGPSWSPNNLLERATP